MWKLVPQSRDPYSLLLTNPERVDIDHLRVLFAKVKRADGCGRNFSRPAAKAFQQWLDNVTGPLPSHAYARLSNWFLTAAKGPRRSQLAACCSELWKAMFTARPSKRLTQVTQNARFIDREFWAWWKNQEQGQARRRIPRET